MTRSRSPLFHSPLLPVLCCGSLFVSLMGGYLIGNSRQLLFVMMFGLLPLMFMALRAFQHLVLAIPFAALFVEFSLSTGTHTRVPTVMLLVLMLSTIWLVTSVVQHRTHLHRAHLDAPLLTFVVICCCAFIWSIVFRDPVLIDRAGQGNFLFVQLGALAAMILSPAVALLIASFVHSQQHLWWIAGPFLVVGIISTIGVFAGRDLTVLNTRGLFPLWFVALGYAIVIAHPGIRLLWRIALGLLLLLHLYIVGIVGISWLSGWVPAIVAILTITLFRSRIAFIALVLGLAGLVLTQYDFVEEHILQEAERDGSYERLTLWQLNLRLISDHPLLGTGPAGYAVYYMTYHPEEARSTHNNYLDIVAQLGILGSLCWIWIVWAGLREGRIVLKHAPPGTLRTLGLAATGGLFGACVAMQLGDWVIPFAYNQGIEGYRYTIFSWIFLGVLMSIRRQVAPTFEHAR